LISPMISCPKSAGNGGSRLNSSVIAVGLVQIPR
jgi:hypothetical protein